MVDTAFQPTYGTELLAQRPVDAVAAGSAAGIDLVVGTTREEALISVVGLKDAFDEELVAAGLDGVMATTGRSGASVLDVYRGNRPDAALHEIAAAVETDRMFRIPAQRLAAAQVAHNPNTWTYEFARRTPVRGGGFGASTSWRCRSRSTRCATTRPAGSAATRRPRSWRTRCTAPGWRSWPAATRGTPGCPRGHGGIPTPARPCASACRAGMMGGKTSGEKLEEALNEHGREGWQLKSVTAVEVKGRLGPGGAEGVLVTFERATG